MAVLDMALGTRSIIRRDPTRLLQIVKELFYQKDLDTLLDKVLFEARNFVNAEAGTLYLAKNRYLYFSFVQNDPLFHEDRPKDKYIYSSKRLPIDKSSLAGYVAFTKDPLLIDDVYHISSDVSYQFNPEFDRKTSYKTESILVVPLETTDQDVLGVLQLINAKNDKGQIIPFSMQDRLYITEFARYAANAIEKAKLYKAMVLRMVEMAQLRDPFETSQHAKRVGAFSIELYKAWAITHPLEERKNKYDVQILRSAAELHDVGKVALSDVILRKPGSLGRDEIIQMKAHTIYGARLFKNLNSPWDRIAAEVALNHHERWDGRGYPGKIDNVHAREIRFGPGKREKDIPLTARIVALADVYDALMSKRAYKDSWKEEQAIRYIRSQQKRQFDPELVELFLNNYDTIRAIRKRYP